MTISPWLLLLLAFPVLWFGEWLVRKIPALGRFNIPAPVAGGLVVCVAVLLLNVSGLLKFSFGTRVDTRWFTWLVSVEPDWNAATPPLRAMTAPFMVGFFACVGLNATWSLVKKGGLAMVLFWAAAAAFAVLQNFVGIGLSKVLGVSPLLGVMCGSVTLTGGHSTAQAFADEFAKAGLAGASVIGVAAATFGLVAGALIGGPIAARLIERDRLKSKDTAPDLVDASAAEEPGFFGALVALGRDWRKVIIVLLVVAICIKGGTWLTYLVLKMKKELIFPTSMGGMVAGLIVRNLHDAFGQKWLDDGTIDRVGAVLLCIFLALVMAGLNLFELAGTAVPMLVILVAQVVLMAAFAYYVTYRVMGRDYDAAVMAAGHCGFGLGATSNAVATMLAIVQRHGPSRRAFLIVPPTGAMLVDVTNAFTITGFLNWMK
jgi:ESS family glutamate:Na+ symporter